MNSKAIAIFAAVTVLAAGGAAYTIMQRPAPVSDRIVEGQLVFPGIGDRLAQAARVEVRKHDATLAVALRDGNWGLEDRGGYPVRRERIRELMAGLTELRIVEARTGDPELFSRLNLEDVTVAGGNSLLLTVKDAQGVTIAELILGKRRVRTLANVPEAIYIRRPGENRTWLAEGNVRVDVEHALWLDRDILDIRRARIREVTNERPASNESVTVRRADPRAEAAALVDPPEGFQVDANKADELARTLEWLSFNDVMPASGLQGAEIVGTSRFVTWEGVTIDARIMRHDGKLWVTFDTAFAAPAEPVQNGPEEIRTPEVARTEIEEAARRMAGWAFNFADWKNEYFTRRLEDMRRPAEEQRPPS